MCKRKRRLSGLVSLCFLLALLGGIPAAAATPQEEWFKSTPTSAVFDSLWVDDIVCFQSQGYYIDNDNMNPAPGNTMTIVSGDCVEIVDVDCYSGFFYKGLKFTKPGKAQVKVKETKKETGASQEKTFSFTVTKRPADKPVTAIYNFPDMKFKIGDSGIPIDKLRDQEMTLKNLNYGLGWGNIRFVQNVANLFSPCGGYGGNETDLVLDDRLYSNKNGIIVHLSGHLGGIENSLAYKPGTYKLQLSYCGTAVGNPSVITVEEPVITTNAPASIKVGGTLNLTTALTNTALKNMKTAKYEDKNNYNQYGEYKSSTEPIIAYKPSVRVLEGKDCVAQSKQDYSNTLTSSETLTFKKAGAVKLKVTYTQFATWPDLLYSYKWDEGKQTYIKYEDDQRYNFEKIITIQVTEDGKPAQPPKGTTASSAANTGKPSSVVPTPGSTASGETTSPTGEPTLPSVEEQAVVLTDEETGIQLGAAEGVVPPDTALVVKSSDFVPEDAAGKFAAFDISLENGGAKIQPNGKVQVSIPVPAGYDKERLTIYHIADDGTKTELPCTVTGDAVTFETDHFSLYVLAEKAAGQAADGTPQPVGADKKGGSPVVWIVLGILLIAATGGGFTLWWFRFRKQPEANPET